MTTNVPQDVIELAKQAGFDVDDDGDIWGSENGSLLRFAELLRAQRQEGSEPVYQYRLLDDPDNWEWHGCGEEQFPDFAMNERFQTRILYTATPDMAAGMVKAAEIVDELENKSRDNVISSALKIAKLDILSAIPADSEAALREVLDKAAKYDAINTPEIAEFLKAVENEALHQRERWGSEHDAGKTDADWFWLVGFLAGKAIRPDNTSEKQLHHIITTAAALLNWHAAKLGTHNAMRPGIGPDAQPPKPAIVNSIIGASSDKVESGK